MQLQVKFLGEKSLKKFLCPSRLRVFVVVAHERNLARSTFEQDEESQTIKKKTTRFHGNLCS
jgi:hypothetical protein